VRKGEKNKGSSPGLPYQTFFSSVRKREGKNKAKKKGGGGGRERGKRGRRKGFCDFCQADGRTGKKKKTPLKRFVAVFMTVVVRGGGGKRGKRKRKNLN